MNKMNKLIKSIEAYTMNTETTEDIYYVPSKQEFFYRIGMNAAQCQFYLKYTHRIAEKIKNAFLSIELLLDHLLHLHADNENRGKKERQTLDKITKTLADDYGWFQ